MVKIKKKFVISLFLTAFLVVVNSIGYGKNSPVPKRISASKLFPVMTWYGLTAQQLDIAHFKELADAGFTVNFSNLGSYELNKKALNLAEKVGIKLIIGDKRIQPGKSVDAAAIKKIDQAVNDYKNFPALLGYFLMDEPGASVFDNLAAIKNEIYLKDKVHLVYVNLLPDYANSKQLGTKNYQEYVDKYIRIFKPEFISYDYYPFINSGFRDTYFQNLGVIRNAALKAGVPFWAFTMSCQIYPAYPSPRESWIRLQLYSDLAYGAKGLQYFTYALPHSNAENFKTAILDAKGKTTYLYGITTKINSEILALIPIIKKLSSEGIYQTKPLPIGTNSLPTNFYIKEITGGPTEIGYFKNKDGQPYLLLVNRNYEKESNINMWVSGRVKGLIEISKSEVKSSALLKPENGKITLHLDKGDGRLFKVL